MKRLFALAMSLGLVAVMAVPVVAGGPADKLTGSGTFINGSGIETYVEFNAHEGRDGRAAKGSLYQRVGTNGDFVVDVTDVVVNGGEECFVGTVVAGSGAYAGLVGSSRATAILDGGEPGIDADRFGGSGGTSCGATKYYVTSGNFQVHWDGSGA